MESLEGRALEERAFFNGLEPKGADVYIAFCKAGGVNLNLFVLGHYIECSSCEYRQKCQQTSNTAGEQAEL